MTHPPKYLIDQLVAEIQAQKVALKQAQVRWEAVDRTQSTPKSYYCQSDFGSGQPTVAVPVKPFENSIDCLPFFPARRDTGKGEMG